MILRIAPGERIEKYVLVKNINDVVVTINISVSGDLKDNLELKENSFELQPEEEKKAYFTIKADDAGTTETKINIGFKPEEGNTVGLSSAVIVIADEKYAGDNQLVEEDEEQSADSEYGEESNSNLISDSANKLKGKISNVFEKNRLVFLLISSLVLICVLIGLYFYSLSVKSKKRVKRRNA